MDIEQAYIIRVLREFQSILMRHRNDEEAARVDRLLSRIASEQNIRRTLCLLYQVQGFDQFALTLLWLIDSVRMEGVSPSDSVRAYEVDSLIKSFPFISQSDKKPTRIS